MIVYHGATEIIKNPDVVHSKNGMILKYYLLKKRMKNGLILCVHVERESHSIENMILL